MRLLERETHLSTLAEYADEARSGHGRLVLVAGEAGIGKSSLLEGFRVTVPDACWYVGACDGLFTPRPLAPLVDIADQMGGELARLCLAGASRDRLFAALLRRLTASDQLIVLVVEDVHWADEATLDLLHFLGRRIRGARTVLLVTYRDDGLTPRDPLRIVLGELSTERTTRRMALPPLSEAAVGVLAADVALEPARLYALTGGNPFFVSEVVQVGDDNLPPSVRDAVLARVAGLGQDSRGVLDVAALIGFRLSLDLLKDVTEATPAIFDDLFACGVLTGDQGGLRFRHELARLAVQSAVAPHRALVAHAEILDVLLAAGCDDDARLAFHAEGAGDGVRVLEFAPRAGRYASSLAAHRESAAQFERALRWASDAEPRTVATLYDELSEQLALIDHWKESADARQQALSLWHAIGDPLREGDTLRRFSRIMWRLCRGDEAERASVAAVRVLEPLGPTPELAWAYANLADQRIVTSDYDEVLRLARLARAMAEQFGLLGALSDALVAEGSVPSAQGGDGEGLLRQALTIAVTAGLNAQAGEAFNALYCHFWTRLQFASGERTFVDGIAYCEQRDLTTFSTRLYGQRTRVLELLGRWDEAEKLALKLVRVAAPSPVHRLNPLVVLGTLRARRGDPNAWTCLDEALRFASGLGGASAIAYTRIARAEAHWLNGAQGEAIRELDLAMEVVEPEPQDQRWVGLWRHRVTGHTMPPGYLSEPFASEHAGNHRRAAEQWSDLGMEYHAAVALLGSDDEGTLRDALCRFDALGAKAASRLTRLKMRRLGISAISIGARPSTKDHPAGLTRREHEVLVLVSAGLTNSDISRRLVLSVKTVDHHVAAILTKLDVPNRRAAAAEAFRLQLVRRQDGEFITRSG